MMSFVENILALDPIKVAKRRSSSRYDEVREQAPRIYPRTGGVTFTPQLAGERVGRRSGAERVPERAVRASEIRAGGAAIAALCAARSNSQQTGMLPPLKAELLRAAQDIQHLLTVFT